MAWALLVVLYLLFASAVIIITIAFGIPPVAAFLLLSIGCFQPDDVCRSSHQNGLLLIAINRVAVVTAVVRVVTVELISLVVLGDAVCLGCYNGGEGNNEVIRTSMRRIAITGGTKIDDVDNC